LRQLPAKVHLAGVVAVQPVECIENFPHPSDKNLYCAVLRAILAFTKYRA
jgi:hypothetical protein